MEPDSWPKLGLVILGIALSALALAGETAFRAIPHHRLQHLSESGDRRAAILERWQEHSRLFGASTMVVTIMGAGLSTALATILSSAHSAPWIFAIYAGASLGVHIIVHGLAHGKPETTALVVAYPLNTITTIFSPLTRFLLFLSQPLRPLITARRPQDTAPVTEEELRAWVDAGEEAGILEEEERDMIDSILEMEETTVHEVMAPRPDIVAVEADTPVAQAADLVTQHGFSRLPVYQGSIDNVLGILYAKDLLRELRAGRDERPVKELARPAYFVPESKKVNELLQELQRRKVHIALIVDEYGGIAGLATIEDLLEEIVGEIQDEHDTEEPKALITGPGEASFDATVSVNDVNETLDLELRAEDSDSIGGLVYEQLGQMPSPGDMVEVGGAKITVLATAGRRIRRVKVVVDKPAEEVPGETEEQGGKT